MAKGKVKSKIKKQSAQVEAKEESPNKCGTKR